MLADGFLRLTQCSMICLNKNGYHLKIFEEEKMWENRSLFTQGNSKEKKFESAFYHWFPLLEI